MKKLVIIVIAALLTLPALSQFKFGLKAGASTTSITMEEAIQVTSTTGTVTTTYAIEKLEGMNFGFHAGVFGRVSISKLFVQPEILFSTRTNEYKVTDVVAATSEDVKQSFSKIDVPVMVGVKLGPARINAGPVGSFLINSPRELIDDPSLETIYGKMSFGYQAGVGVDLVGLLTVDLRYEGSLKKYQNQIENAAGVSFNLDDRPSAFLLSIGLMF
jgi:hypothetical protein